MVPVCVGECHQCGVHAVCADRHHDAHAVHTHVLPVYVLGLPGHPGQDDLPATLHIS